jgi:hypothetical protein
VQLQTVVWLFMAVLEQWLLPCRAVFQVMSTQDSFYCGYIYFYTRFLQHLHTVLCCCPGIVWHFSHQSTFISRWQNTSPSWALWRMRGPMVFVTAYYCLYRWTCTIRHLEIAPKDEPDVEVYSFFSWGLGWLLLIFPYCQAKRHWGWR